MKQLDRIFTVVEYRWQEYGCSFYCYLYSESLKVFLIKHLRISQLWVPIPGAVCDSRISQTKRVYCCFPQSLWHVSLSLLEPYVTNVLAS